MTIGNIQRAKVFFEPIELEGKSILGNPAGIVLCKNGLPGFHEMKTMAMEVSEPIVGFVSQDIGNIFNIAFFFPDGQACFLCGHGTLAAAYFVSKQFGYSEVVFRIPGHTVELRCKVNEGMKVDAFFQPYQLLPIGASRLSLFLPLLGLQSEQLEDQFYNSELNDCVLVLKDCLTLRSLDPDYTKLSAAIREEGLRAIMITAASGNDFIDYEIRIFCPYVPGDEDISCGSANCYLLPYWKGKIHADNPTEDLAILCPFKPLATSFGGIEYGNYMPEENLVNLSGKIYES